MTSNLDLSESGDAFPDNRGLGAATFDRLRHGVYRIVIEGESFHKPNRRLKTAKSSLQNPVKNTFLRPFESAFDTTFNWHHYGNHPRRCYVDP